MTNDATLTAIGMKDVVSEQVPIVAPDRLMAERTDAGVSYDQVAALANIDVERLAGVEFGADGYRLTLVEVERWCEAVGCSVLDLLMPLDLDVGLMARSAFLAIGEDGTVCYLAEAAGHDAIRRTLSERCGGGVVVSTRTAPRPEGWNGTDLVWVPGPDASPFDFMHADASE